MNLQNTYDVEYKRLNTVIERNRQQIHDLQI